jgi:NAD(P)-dependent dehydrogenase (short-subunit alcohol dehydrogenase family)
VTPAAEMLLKDKIATVTGGGVGMTRIGASQLAPHNINVNAICPGATRSEMYDTIIRQIVDRDTITEAEAIARIDASIPLRRSKYRGRHRQPGGLSGLGRITEYHRPIVERRWRIDVGLAQRRTPGLH